MNYDRNKRKDYAVIIAAVAVTVTVMLGGIISGLVLAVRQRRESVEINGSRQAAEYLLRDSARELKGAMSALRLCNESEPAEALCRTGLVFAVRAEAALECHDDDWADSRAREQFLNDISTVLHTYAPEKTMDMSDMLYEYSSRFCDWAESGAEFDYNGELIDAAVDEAGDKATEEDIAAASELVKDALSCDAEYVGDYGGHIEFNTERDGKTGYAVVCGKKIIEFAFVRDDGAEDTNTQTAKQVALKTASDCGYDGLDIKWCEVTGRSVSVVMCRSYDGAIACDDSAIAVVYGGQTVAFTAGGCDNEHKDIPSPKKTEAEAHAALKRDADKGTLVVRTVGDRERICYEYRYELDDGVHYVYVCAESGKQMEVK